MVRLRERKFQLKTSRDKDFKEERRKYGKLMMFRKVDRSNYPKIPFKLIIIGAVIIGFIYIMMKTLLM